MPQRLTQKPVTTFIKGLVTEAGELTFPPDASIDESNCDLRRDGSRRRRKGAALESGSTLSSFTISDSDVVSTGTWKNVGGQSGLEYLIVQIGSTLYFYNKASAPYSDGVVANTVDLTTYQAVGAANVAEVKCQYASIQGALVVASEGMDTIYIERDNAAGTISETSINFRTRDFEWLGDTTTYSTGLAGAAVERQYDTMNSGWVGTKGAAALASYISGHSSKYPPLTLPWYSGKDSSGNYSNTEWDKIYSGTTLIGNGHFILDFFNKDRGTESGLAISAEAEESRFKSVETLGGRVFYAGLNSAKNSGVILFSRLIEDVSELGECLQRNDPTSEEFSDLLDTDGGVIRIADAVGIKKLYAVGANLMVFADNGVWSINGVDGVFRASEYSVKKVSEVGISSPESFVSADGAPVWWSNYGIHTVTFDQVSGAAQEQNLTISTVQSFWDDIPSDSKLSVISVYDKVNKRAYWAWPSSGETVTSKVNNFLVLDLALQAFYPWTVEDETTSTNAIIGLAFYTGLGADTITFNVTTSAGDNVVTSAGDNVVSEQLSNLAVGTGSPDIILLIRDGDTNKLTMGGFVDADFLDWGTVNYSSYAVAGYDFMGDMLLKKNAPYVTTYMRVTETGWSGTEEGGYTPVGESSLMVSAFWDFKSTSSSSPQEAYRQKLIPVVDPGDLGTYGYPDSVVTTRLKVRGHGRSMRLKFESSQGKDFVLLGYSVLGGVNARF